MFQRRPLSYTLGCGRARNSLAIGETALQPLRESAEIDGIQVGNGPVSHATDLECGGIICRDESKARNGLPAVAADGQTKTLMMCCR